MKSPEQMSNQETTPSLTTLAEKHEELIDVTERIEENINEIQQLEDENIDPETEEDTKKENNERIKALKKALDVAKAALIAKILDIGLDTIFEVIAVAAFFDAGDSKSSDMTERILAEQKVRQYVEDQIAQLYPSYADTEISLPEAA